MARSKRERLALILSCTLATACLNLFLPVTNGDVSATLEVDVSKPGPTIPPLFAGLMTEEINHAYEGGLFAELIQNRTFQDGTNTFVSEWATQEGSPTSDVNAGPADAAFVMGLE